MRIHICLVALCFAAEARGQAITVPESPVAFTLSREQLEAPPNRYVLQAPPIERPLLQESFQGPEERPREPSILESEEIRIGEGKRSLYVKSRSGGAVIGVRIKK